MASNIWTVTDSADERKKRTLFSGEDSCGDTSTPPRKKKKKLDFQRLNTLADRVRKRVSEAGELLTRLQKGEDTCEYDEVVIDQLEQSVETFVKELKDLSRNEKFRKTVEEPQYTNTQMEAEDLLVVVKRVYKNSMKRENLPSPKHTPIMNSRLPKIELPKFDGSKLKWYEFWGRFKSSVDSRTDLPEVVKLDYLLSQLEGEARDAVQGLDITESNYKIALGILTESFGKPDLVIDAHYEALDNITPASDDPKECRKVLNQLERHLKVLNTLGEDVNKNNQLRHMLPKKFPQDMRFDISMAMRNRENTVQNLRQALAEIIAAKETTYTTKQEQGPSGSKSFTTETLVSTSSSKKGTATQPPKSPWNQEPNTTEGHNESTQLSQQDRPKGPPGKKRRFQCIFCKEGHYPDECKRYASITERKSKLSGRCFTCLGANHLQKDCPRAKRTCAYCRKTGHHRSLCFSKFNQKNQETTVSTISQTQSDTVLQTALAKVRNKESNVEMTSRLLFDTGSQKSYITSETANRLELTPIEVNSLTVYTFGHQKPKVIDSKLVSIEIGTPEGDTTQILAYVIPTITGIVPAFVHLKSEIQQNYPNLIMAPDDEHDSKASILIGNDHYHSFFTGERQHVKDNLYLVQSKLGWILSGCQYHKDKEILSVLTYVQCGRPKDVGQIFTLPDPPLQDDSIKDIWELESIGIRDSPKLLEEDEIIRFFNDTTIFQGNRYQVKWPWIQYPTDLPINYGMALGRLTGLVNRIDQSTLAEYDKVLKDQLEKGMVEVVYEEKLPSHPVHYLPHHCVIQPHKSTKLRVVYDASAKSRGKCSLNEYLFKGPLMLENLVSLVLGFRNHQIGMTADIEKAFLQVGLQSEDRDVTRFLWLKDINRGTSEDNIVHMRFCRVPFGVISSPYLLAATIRHHLTKKHSVVADEIARCLYVDNLVTGVQSVDAGSSLYRMAVEAFRELSMNIRDWATNSPELRELIPAEHRCESSSTTSVLGLRWNTDADTLGLMVDPTIFVKPVSSKREILRMVASVFDPCGFVAPLVLSARIFLQLLWTENYKWDTPLEVSKVQEWKKCTQPLQFIKEVEIPRYHFESMFTRDACENDSNIELHCFTDASKDAYSAVVYVRRVENDVGITVNLVMSRTRLTPVRSREHMTTPKLELLGVLIGARLVSYVQNALRLTGSMFLWTDSQVVLGWMNSGKLLQPFVSRRINEIKAFSSLQLRYVCSQDNPADLATKPHCAALPHQWFHGPRFLRLSENEWPPTANFLHALDCVLPCKNSEPSSSSKTEGQTDQVKANHIDQSNKPGTGLQVGQDNEIDGCPQGDNAMIPTVKTGDIRAVQHDSFPKELEGHPTHLKKSLSLFVDEQGLLRCTGRLQNAALPYDQKFPILLPANNPFTSRIISEYHVKNHHVGANQTLTLLRRKYWVPQGKSQVRNVLTKCTQCIKYGGGPYKLPPMPPLPPERVKLCHPFIYTGLDYLGPLTTVNNVDPQKRWCCIFTCMASRAIHLELVNNSSASEFLLCLRRFVACRGIPALIVSDNAMQFKLASEVVQAPLCKDNNVAWHFIPELAPWQGGFYERLVGLVKHCLRRTLDKNLLSDSQLATVIKEIESILNARPLTAVDDSLDHILTPSDFLSTCGTHLMNPPVTGVPTNITATKAELIDGWKQGKMVVEEFRSMFMNVYLTSLRERAQVPHRQHRILAHIDPKVGDIVQIWDDRSKTTNRAHWKVGRIEALVPSSDGLVRTAKVKLDSGAIFTRSISHLYPLELPTDTPQQDNSIQSVPTTIAPLQGDHPDAHDSPSEPLHVFTEEPPETAIASTTAPPAPSDPALQSPQQLDGEAPAVASDEKNPSQPRRKTFNKCLEKIRQWTQSLASVHEIE